MKIRKTRIFFRLDGKQIKVKYDKEVWKVLKKLEYGDIFKINGIGWLSFEGYNLKYTPLKGEDEGYWKCKRVINVKPITD